MVILLILPKIAYYLLAGIKVAAFSIKNEETFGFQYPEVYHSIYGKEMLSNFIQICSFIKIGHRFFIELTVNRLKSK